MKTKKLGEIADIYTGARISRYQNNTTQQPVIQRKYKQKKPIIKNEEVSEDLNKKFYSKQDDIILSLHDPNLIFKLNKKNTIIPMYYLIIRVKEEYNPTYVYYVLKNKILKKEISRLTEGSTLKIIKTNNLKEIKIPLINKEKQSKYGKIAELIEKRILLKQKAITLDENLEKSILTNLMETE